MNASINYIQVPIPIFDLGFALGKIITFLIYLFAIYGFWKFVTGWIIWVYGEVEE